MSQSPTPDSNLYQGRQLLEQLQSQSENLILVAFVGPHCGACATLKPVLHQLVSDKKEPLYWSKSTRQKSLSWRLQWAFTAHPPSFS